MTQVKTYLAVANTKGGEPQNGDAFSLPVAKITLACLVQTVVREITNCLKLRKNIAR